MPATTLHFSGAGDVCVAVECGGRRRGAELPYLSQDAHRGAPLRGIGVPKAVRARIRPVPERYGLEQHGVLVVRGAPMQSLQTLLLQADGERGTGIGDGIGQAV